MHENSKVATGHVRWIICALLFFATTINYTDRAVLGVIEPNLAKLIPGWNATNYGWINSAFMIAYAIGSLGAGWMMDRIGVRLGFAISLIVWSLAAAAHAFAGNVFQFCIARFALEIGEAGLVVAEVLRDQQRRSEADEYGPADAPADQVGHL